MDKKILQQLIKRVQNDEATPKDKVAILKELNISFAELNERLADLLNSVKNSN
jgi:hypothetical protein